MVETPICVFGKRLETYIEQLNYIEQYIGSC